MIKDVHSVEILGEIKKQDAYERRVQLGLEEAKKKTISRGPINCCIFISSSYIFQGINKMSPLVSWIHDIPAEFD